MLLLLLTGRAASGCRLLIIMACSPRCPAVNYFCVGLQLSSSSEQQRLQQRQEQGKAGDRSPGWWQWGSWLHASPFPPGLLCQCWTVSLGSGIFAFLLLQHVRRIQMCLISDRRDMLGQANAQGQGHILCCLWMMISALQKVSLGVRFLCLVWRQWGAGLGGEIEPWLRAAAARLHSESPWSWRQGMTFLLEAQIQQDQIRLEPSGPIKPAWEDSMQTTTCSCLGMANACGQCAGEELPQAESIPSARTSSWAEWLQTHSSFEVEQPRSPPSEQPPLVLVVVTVLLAFNIGVNPRQGVSSENPISQLSIANPCSEGRSSLQACSCWNTHRGLCITSCHCHTRGGQCQGHQAGTAPWARSCMVWKRRLPTPPLPVTHQQNCSDLWPQLGHAALCCRQVCRQARKHLPSKYALNSTKLAPPFNDEVGELYWQYESRCPVLWEGRCPCYAHTHEWEGQLSHFPFPDFSKFTLLGIQTS